MEGIDGQYTPVRTTAGVWSTEQIEEWQVFVYADETVQSSRLLRKTKG